MRHPGALAAVAMLVLPAAVHAQGDRWEHEVRLRLARTGEALTPGGYRVRSLAAEGTLFVGESRQVDLPVTAGTEYLLAGSCDADCTALSLVLANSTGYQVDAARGPGVTPVVRIAPTGATGPYRLTITMMGCRVSPCRYGVAVFERATPQK
jgi:hypothetical protein